MGKGLKRGMVKSLDSAGTQERSSRPLLAAVRHEQITLSSLSFLFHKRCGLTLMSLAVM